MLISATPSPQVTSMVLSPSQGASFLMRPPVPAFMPVSTRSTFQSGNVSGLCRTSSPERTLMDTDP